MAELAHLFEGLVCIVLLTCVWTTHPLPCCVYTSFTGQYERKTHNETLEWKNS